jgi:hypothetical protein
MKVAGSGLGTVKARAICGVRGICLRKICMMKRALSTLASGSVERNLKTWCGDVEQDGGSWRQFRLNPKARKLRVSAVSTSLEVSSEFCSYLSDIMTWNDQASPWAHTHTAGSLSMVGCGVLD